MKVLDLFCGAGGAAMGLHRAGFDVIGVDIKPQPRYPFKFVQGDAISMLANWSRASNIFDEDFQDFDLIWASPPCQRYTRMLNNGAAKREDHPGLIEQTRRLLKWYGIPYVIENVVGAPLDNPVMLCGEMFGLKTYRHRLFEANFPIEVPVHPKHVIRTERAGRPSAGYLSVAGHFPGVDIIREAWGVPWMVRDEIAQAIPPAFSEHIARQAAVVASA